MPEIKTHTILIKGDHATMRSDKILQKTFSDISYGYGKILFRGTDEERDAFGDYLVENEGKLRFKII